MTIVWTGIQMEGGDSFVGSEIKMTLEDKGYWVALSMAPGIGPKRFQKILDFFGSAEAGWKGSMQAWEKLLGAKAAAGFYEFRKGVDPVGILERLDRKAIK